MPHALSWFTAITATASIALSTAWLASPAQAATTRAGVTGQMWSTPVADGASSDTGAPRQAQVVYAYPGGPTPGEGEWAGRAEARVGVLKASARIQVIDAPGSANSNDNQAQAVAAFTDQWILNDRPLDTPGKLRLVLHFSGTASGTAAAPAFADTFGQLSFSILSLAGNTNIVDAADYFRKVDSGGVAEDAVLNLSFLYGRPLLLNASLVANAQLRVGRADAVPVTGEGSAQFGNTAAVTSLQVWDPDTGTYTGRFSLLTESPTPYPFQAPVPEPSAAWLAGAGLLALALWRVRTRA